MRIRTIKPEFWSSFSVAKLSEPAVIMAIGLMNHACDKGYFEADPRMIKASVLPLREPSRSIPGVLQELSSIGYIELRIAHDGRLIGRIVNFSRHQIINKPGKLDSKAYIDFASASAAKEFSRSDAPLQMALPEDSRSPTTPLPEPSGKRTAGTGNREQGTDKAPAASCLPQSLQNPEFETAWADWNRHLAEMRQPLKPTAEAAALAQFAKLGSTRSVAAIRFTIFKGWRGLREPDASDRQFQVSRAAEEATEPEGWRAYWRETYPPEEYPDAARYDEGEWSAVRSDHKREIREGMRRRGLL